MEPQRSKRRLNVVNTLWFNRRYTCTGGVDSKVNKFGDQIKVDSIVIVQWKTTCNQKRQACTIDLQKEGVRARIWHADMRHGIFTSRCRERRVWKSEALHDTALQSGDDDYWQTKWWRLRIRWFLTLGWPNLNWEDILPSPWLVDVHPIRASMKAAVDTTFNVEGVIRLSVKIKGRKTKTNFGVAPRLAKKTDLWYSAYGQRDWQSWDRRSTSYPKKWPCCCYRRYIWRKRIHTVHWRYHD